MAQPVKWRPLGKVDYDGNVSEGVIELPNSEAEKAGGHKVLVVRCKGDSSVEHAPDLQLRVKLAVRRYPVVSEVDRWRLGVAEYGEEVEARNLTLSERTKRIAVRSALPMLVLLAALAALTAALFPGLKDTMTIVTAVLAIPAAIATIVKAIKET